MSARADLCGGRSAMIVPTATSPFGVRVWKSALACWRQLRGRLVSTSRFVTISLETFVAKDRRGVRPGDIRKTIYRTANRDPSM